MVKKSRAKARIEYKIILIFLLFLFFIAPICEGKELITRMIYGK